jgi:hypothetical protein
VTKLKEGISVSKRARQKVDLERFELKKLDDVEVKEKYQVEISNRFATLETLKESSDINKVKVKVSLCLTKHQQHNVSETDSVSVFSMHAYIYIYIYI